MAKAITIYGMEAIKNYYFRRRIHFYTQAEFEDYLKGIVEPNQDAWSGFNRKPESYITKCRSQDT